jgi:hypothetical protein
MSPLALCDDCPTEFSCVDDGCQRAKNERAMRMVDAMKIAPHESGAIVLNEEQWEDFMYHMTHPKPPTPAMIEAAKKMLEWSKRPGDLEYESWSNAAVAPEGKDGG